MTQANFDEQRFADEIRKFLKKVGITSHIELENAVRAAAGEFGLDFLPLGWEAFDLAMPRGIYFRTLFRTLLETLRSSECQRLAQVFGGYEFGELGNVVWAA